MSDFNQRASKGQAYNLAVATAIAEGKQHNNEYIVKQYLRHLQFANILQKATPEQLEIAINNPEVLAKLREIEDML